MDEVITINASRTISVDGVTIEVRGNPIDHHFDVGELGAGPAAAIRAAIEAGIRQIAQRAAPATLLFRAAAARALSKGKAWAVARYGDRMPDSSTALFNDSGELAGAIGVQANGDTWEVTAPGDRFDAPGTTAESLFERLTALVPAIADPTSVQAVADAIEATWAMIVRQR